MDMESYRDEEDHGVVLCGCSCSFCGSGSLPSVLGARSLKRKIFEMKEEVRCKREPNAARVEIENEFATLRKAIGCQQQTIFELHSDLDEERAAAATAASEAMSMILRVQREKADAQMDARQFKLFAEEKMAHDQQEIDLLEDLLFQRDEVVESLSCEIQSYRHQLLSIGINPFLCQPNYLSMGNDGYHFPLCNSGVMEKATTASYTTPGNKYVSSDTPREHLHCNPSYAMENGLTDFVYSPSGEPIGLSMDSYGSPSFQKGISKEEFPARLDPDSASDIGGGGRDDISDRVYTIDSACDVDWSTPMELLNRRNLVPDRSDEAEIKSLHMRLQALEEERELAKQAILAMETGKGQVVLLEEIAKKLRKEVTPQRSRIMKKPSFLRTFSLISAIKWAASFFFWRKKSSRIKYSFGISSHNIGLLILLEKSQGARQRRCLARVQR